MGLTSVPPSSVHCLKSWKSQPPGTLRASPAQGLLCCLFLMHSTYLGTADGSVVLDTTRGRRHNEFFLLQSHGSFVFKIVQRRAEETAKLYKTQKMFVCTQSTFHLGCLVSASHRFLYLPALTLTSSWLILINKINFFWHFSEWVEGLFYVIRFIFH